MRKEILILIFLILLALLILIFILPNEQICGPSSLGSGRNSSYCDKSCVTDADCKIICGCGAINKDESCDTTGAEIDCIYSEAKCSSGKCVEVIPARVAISTDKESYYIGEKVNIIVTSNKMVYEDYYGPQIEIFQEDEWNALSTYCLNDKQCKDGQLSYLMFTHINPTPQFKGERTTAWSQKYCLSETKMCGNQSYDNKTMINLTLSDPAQLKAKFCYWDESDFNASTYSQDIEKRKCVEDLFTITP